MRHLYSGGTDFSDRPPEDALLETLDGMDTGVEPEDGEPVVRVSAEEAESETVRPDRPAMTLDVLQPYYLGTHYAAIAMHKKLQGEAREKVDGYRKLVDEVQRGDPGDRREGLLTPIGRQKRSPGGERGETSPVGGGSHPGRRRANGADENRRSTMTERTTQNAAAADTFALGGDLGVNRLGFGAMRLTGERTWGEPENPEEAKAVLGRAVELSINLIDTADSYGPEVSERLIGETLHPRPGRPPRRG